MENFHSFAMNYGPVQIRGVADRKRYLHASARYEYCGAVALRERCGIRM